MLRACSGSTTAPPCQHPGRCIRLAPSSWRVSSSPPLCSSRLSLHAASDGARSEKTTAVDSKTLQWCWQGQRLESKVIRAAATGTNTLRVTRPMDSAWVPEDVMSLSSTSSALLPRIKSDPHPVPVTRLLAFSSPIQILYSGHADRTRPV